MPEFKVGGTFICTLAHYKIFYSNTKCYRAYITYRLTWGYNYYKNTAKKNTKLKSNQRNHTTPK